MPWSFLFLGRIVPPRGPECVSLEPIIESVSSLFGSISIDDHLDHTIIRYSERVGLLRAMIYQQFTGHFRSHNMQLQSKQISIISGVS